MNNKKKLENLLKKHIVKFDPNSKGFFRVIEKGYNYSLCTNIVKFLSDTFTDIERICIPNTFIDSCITINGILKAIAVGVEIVEREDGFCMLSHPNYIFLNSEKINKIGCIRMKMNIVFLPIEYYVKNVYLWERIMTIEKGKEFVELELIKRDCKTINLTKTQTNILEELNVRFKSRFNKYSYTN